MKETTVILKNSGNEYGYEALKKALADPESIVGIIYESGIRGRGGAGFPISAKWKLVRDTPADRKYVICNADEGEPGTGKDRVTLSVNPYSVIEGMAVCAVAVGADTGYIYIRGEYPYVKTILDKAVDEAYGKGFLGKGILGSGVSFDVKIRSGSGSYVCGEETGLIESIEGNRGEPRMKPPFPGAAGLWGKPTVVNNAESFANIPVILNKGAAAYKELGTVKCPGTKLFTLSGNITNPGVYEFPIGVTMRELFEGVGGGCPSGKKLKGILTGGASGTIVPPDMLDTPMDMESCMTAGTVFGAGDLMFFDEDTCVVELVKNLTEFFSEESCGNCAPCRIGLHRMVEILTKILEGKGNPEDLERLEKLANHIKMNSRCGLGQSASTPVLSALQNFRVEYEDLVRKEG